MYLTEFGLQPQLLLSLAFILLLSVVRTACGPPTKKCNWDEKEEAKLYTVEERHDRLSQCYHYIGTINTLILHTNGTNFTHICGTIQQYVDCMAPATKCRSIVKEYWRYYSAYTSEPYSCKLYNATLPPPATAGPPDAHPVKMSPTRTSEASSMSGWRLWSAAVLVMISALSPACLSLTGS